MAKRSRYIKAMVDNPDDTHAQLVRKSNRYYNKNMKLDLSGPLLARLAAEAEEEECSVEQLVSDIVTQWLYDA
jgi:predicted HicB family RNase H-like nuclease